MKSTFKKLFQVVLFLPLLSYANGSSTKDSTKSIECLKIIGLAIDEYDIAVDGVEIRLFQQNDEMEQIEITSVEHHDHNFNFTLESNQYYTIEVSKAGYVTRRVVFYTDLPDDVVVSPLFTYEFDVILLKEKKMDDYYLDFPVALIRYNKKTDSFESNMKYTKYIKTKIAQSEEAAILGKAINHLE